MLLKEGMLKRSLAVQCKNVELTQSLSLASPLPAENT